MEKGDEALREPLVVSTTVPNDPVITVSTTGTDEPKTEEQPPVLGGCRDPAFAALFVAMATTILAFAVKGGHHLFHDTGDSSNDDNSTDDNGFNRSKVGKVCGCLAALAVLAGAICACWLHLVMRHAESILLWSYRAYFALLAAAAVAAFAYGQVVLGVLLVIVLAVFWCAWRAIRARVPFAAANLVTACSALKRHCSVYTVTVLMIVTSVLWAVTWALSLVGIFWNQDGSVNGVLVFALLLAYFWGAFVCANVSHVTVAGTVGSWWFKPADEGAVRGSFARAVTTSFGSVCFGSLIVAVLETLKSMAKYGRRSRNCCTCLLVCCLQCIEDLAQYLNRYAFCFVGLYGLDFVTSGRKVYHLFKDLGWLDAVVNDNTVSVAFFVGSLSCGLFTGVVGVALAFATFADPSDALVWGFAVWGFFVGYCIAGVVSNTVSSAVATVFVAFAESDESLQRNHPEHFLALFEAWRRFHPMLVAHVVVLPEVQALETTHAPAAVVVIDAAA